jgi:hypothetical protein
VLPRDPARSPDAFVLGARPGVPALDGPPVAGATAELAVPVEVAPDIRLGTSYRLGARWIPLDATAMPADPGSGDETTLVARESAAALVEVTAATTRDAILTAPIALPAASGRFRLEVTIHDAEGVALPYSVQAGIPGIVVYVGGPGAAWLEAPPVLTVTAGTLASVQVLVTNGEPEPWGWCAEISARLGPDADAACPVVRLVGRWLAIDGSGTAAPMVRLLAVPAATAAPTWLSGSVPSGPGTYLLVASLERSAGDGRPQVLGRPITITVAVVAAPLVPTPVDD